MSKTEYPDLKHEVESNGHEPAQELSTEEKIKAAVEKYRPYIMRLWQARWKLVMINGIVAVLTVLYLLFIAKPYFESTITILPEYGNKSSMLGQLSGLAAMAGMNLGEAEPTAIYENIIRSESVINPVVYNKYTTEEYSNPVNLIEYFEIEPDEDLKPDLQKRKMFLELYEELIKYKIKTNLDRKTTILTVTVEMPESKLSSDVANKIAEELDTYVRTQRKSYATEQSYYLEKRVKQVFDSLTMVEEKLKNFQEQNRMVSQSPKLMLEQARLIRAVEILQTVYAELTKQLEIAKIDEIKDAPVIDIQEEVNEPIIKTGPRRISILIIILFLSSILSVAYIIFNVNIFRSLRIMKGI